MDPVDVYAATVTVVDAFRESLHTQYAPDGPSHTRTRMFS